jgi:hypothetical protein
MVCRHVPTASRSTNGPESCELQANEYVITPWALATEDTFITPFS